jgi:hypothetical protein
MVLAIGVAQALLMLLNDLDLPRLETAWGDPGIRQGGEPPSALARVEAPSYTHPFEPARKNSGLLILTLKVNKLVNIQKGG